MFARIGLQLRLSDIALLSNGAKTYSEQNWTEHKNTLVGFGWAVWMGCLGGEINNVKSVVM